ncbi:MAG TPA: UDP-3-O-(3-hydroxymyristoyl)glucosamine N-acyltransferase [Rhodocyclaceae bacterium]|nr:UDP-3-O-(3-hydroxymyristoyl)glucosamine N-acyltransferase [Rhodocyclaceae bacterium]HNH34399.1 UDP-3-O-(3-hydroxymyristoyl)glucosamine N-acyltransferase [Rhodocyclaceae bacterium]
MAVSLAEIVARFGGELVGPGNLLIDGTGTLVGARSGQIAFLANPRYTDQLGSTHASAVILGPEVAADCPVAAIVTPQPYLYFARLSGWLYPAPAVTPGVHPTAVVECHVPEGVCVGPLAWIGTDVTLGEGVVIGSHCRIGARSMVGEGSRLHGGATIYPECVVGNRFLGHSGCVIGADGFGFALDEDRRWVKIPQTGRAVIGDDVEVGANTTIDRGALEDTVIGDGVKLDNQIQVGHNVRIGAHTAMAGCVGIAGSARIGARCTVGGGSIILGHLEIADDVHISAGTLVGKSIRSAGTYSGTVPFLEHREWLRNFAHIRRLEAMSERIRALEARLATLENRP